ncbi:hypothetical protein [Anaerocolumna aminovalerica]|uniref:hypothetical protein n=1 Tax=Anaerocolumna aminovalerica TaxID=1527 RepID=UPI00248C92DE|nr:hypothetical protein [Anaerocolumna aminovalerica]
MVDFGFSRFGLKFREVMFQNSKEFTFNNEDVCLYHQNINDVGMLDIIKPKYSRIDTQYTIHTDLSVSEEELNIKISKNFRYEIRRAQRENIKIHFLKGKEALESPDILNQFEQTYNNMFVEKNMSNRLNMKYVIAALKAEAMVLSIAIDGKSGQTLVYHAYVIDEDNALLLYSASKLWTDKVLGNLIGYANKYLHWEDMCYMKHVGIQNFEWGGISSKDEPNGIDKFKMSFGGEVVQLKNCIFANSLKGRLYVKVLKERDKRKNEINN